jgi:hypothetical protein
MGSRDRSDGALVGVLVGATVVVAHALSDRAFEPKEVPDPRADGFGGTVSELRERAAAIRARA